MTSTKIFHNFLLLVSSRKLWLLVIIGILLVGTAGATTILNDTFDGGFIPPEWIQTQTPTLSNIVYHSFNGSVFLDTGSGESETITQSFDPQMGKLNVSMYMNHTSTNPSYYSSVRLLNSSNIYGILIAFEGNNLKYYAGGSYNTICTTPAGEWWKIDIIINISSYTYDIYVNDSLQKTNAIFANNISNISKIQFNVNYNYPNPVYVDDVNIENTSTSVACNNPLGSCYYVATWGNNASAGTLDAPWQNITYANDNANSNDTIFLIDGGEWINEHIVISKDYMTFKAYNGTPKMNGSDLTGHAFNFAQHNNTLVYGLEITHYLTAVDMGGRNNVVSNNHLHTMGGLVIGTGTGGSTDNILENNTIERPGVGANIIQASGNRAISAGGNGIPSVRIVIRNNTIQYTNAHNGLDVFGMMNDTIIENNIFNYITGGPAIYHHDGSTGDRWYNATIRNNTFNGSKGYISLKEGIYNITIRDNNFTGIDSSNYPIDMQPSGSPYSSGAWVYNNSFSSYYTAILTGWANVDWENNTVVSVSSGGLLKVSYTLASNITIYNPLGITKSMSVHNNATASFGDRNNKMFVATVSTSSSPLKAIYTGGSCIVISSTKWDCFPVFYPNGSKGTMQDQSGSTNQAFTQYPIDITIQPSQNNVTASNTTDGLTVDYQSNTIPRLNFTFGTGIGLMNVTLNNVSTGANYSLYYDNGTWINSTIASSSVYFNLSLPNGDYYITEGSPTTYNISGYINDTLGVAIDSVSVVNGSYSASTNVTGYYQVTSVINGTWNFTYSKTGYVTNYKEITVNGADVVNQNVTLTSLTPTITLLDYYGLNSSGSKITVFNTSNLTTIEKMVLNFSISAGASISDWYFNFTANGTGGCSLGNKQSSNCYNYSNVHPYKWIQFINNTDTTEYDGTTGNQGDSISVSQSGSGNLIYVNLTIDEHYNPNVFKWYLGLLNFTDVKWQDGVDQRITKDNMIKVDVDMDLLPLDADQYKLDFRVNYTRDALLPTQRLQAFACNKAYTTGDAELTSNCMIIAEKLPSELQDDGTKFRAIFTKNVIDELGNVSSIILRTDQQTPSKYYYIKTYKATAGGYTTHWNYSTNIGDTWTNSGDGYETELNINWFYNGASPTAFVYQMYANVSGTTNTSLGDIQWAINASQNYPPLIDLITPLSNSSITLPYTSTFKTIDPNDDELNISLLLYNLDGTLYQSLITGMNQTNTSYLIDNIASGEYQIVLRANETATADLYSVTTTRNITISNEFVPPTPIISNVTTGIFYVNTTWSAGSGNVTDGYNSTNGTTWINNTLPYRNTTLSAHSWQNLTIYAFNSSGTGTLNLAALTNNTRIPNNIPANITLLAPTNGSTVTSIPVNFTWNAGTDLDSDTLTYDLRVNGTTVSTGITASYNLYSLVNGINNWSVRSNDGYNYSNWSVVYDITYSEEESTSTSAVIPSYGGGGSGWAVESLDKTTTDAVTILPAHAQEESILSLSTNNFTFYYKSKSPITLRMYDMSFKSECETVKVTVSNTNDIVSINTSCKIHDSNIRFIIPNTQSPDSVYYKMYDLLWVKKSSVPTDMTPDGLYLAVLVQDSSPGQYTFTQSNPLYELQQIAANPGIIIDILKVIDIEIYAELSKKVDFKW